MDRKPAFAGEGFEPLSHLISASEAELNRTTKIIICPGPAHVKPPTEKMSFETYPETNMHFKP